MKPLLDRYVRNDNDKPFYKEHRMNIIKIFPLYHRYFHKIYPNEAMYGNRVIMHVRETCK